MRISDLVIMGLKNLSRRKARTLLTVLGVVIGTLSIIIMISIGIGMGSNYQSQIMQWGSLTTINVNADQYEFDDDGSYIGSRKQELNDEVVAKIKTIDHVRAVSPVIRKSANLYSGKYQGWAYITAMDSSTFKDFDFPALQFGEYPTEEDKSVIVFGSNAPEFYDPKSRFWQEIELDLQKEKIVLRFSEYPVAQQREFSLPIKNVAKMEETNSDYNWNTYMDLEYFKSIYMKYCNTLSLQDRKKALKSLSQYQSIMVNVDNVKHVEEVQSAIEELGFKSYSLVSDLAPLTEASDTLQMVLGALGAVAMIVSAISIANTMVMSIYERTREIGIMKVLGCVIKDIRKLFLFEAGMIGLIGGIIGIGLGYVASILVNKFGEPIFKALMSGNYMYNMENTAFSIIPIWLPFIALIIAIMIGLISGYFPARRATKISAIEAMRTDG